MGHPTGVQNAMPNDGGQGAAEGRGFVSRRMLGGLLCVVLFGVTVCAVLAGGRQPRPGEAQLVYRKDSLYHQIFVYRQGSIVTLRFGKSRFAGRQSELDLGNLWRHCLEYTELAYCGLLYKPDPAKILVVGLGGGTIPRDMHHYLPEAEIDVVELDPEILKVAEEYFHFEQDEKLRVHVADGRMLVRKLSREQSETKYDMVILDAFNSDYIPFHLMTREFLKEVQGILSDDGVVVANVWYTNRLFDAELKTFLEVYGRSQVFFGARSGNALLVALGPDVEVLGEKEAAEAASELQGEHKFAFDIREVAKRLRLDARPDPDAKVLTDDLAPVNWLREQERAEQPPSS